MKTNAIRSPSLSMERVVGIARTFFLICIAVYFLIGICRFLGVALMHDPEIRPEMFLDWWWIRPIQFLWGK